MFYVYVLYSVKFNKIYIGYTSDLISRFESHNKLAAHGWTVRFRPWEIYYFEEFETKSLALRREKELKTASGRKFIRDMIKSKPD